MHKWGDENNLLYFVAVRLGLLFIPVNTSQNKYIIECQ